VTLVDCGEPCQTPILRQISTLGQFRFFASKARPRRQLNKGRVRGLFPFGFIGQLNLYLYNHPLLTSLRKAGRLPEFSSPLFSKKSRPYEPVHMHISTYNVLVQQPLAFGFTQ
jgi:hypothetical protein